MLVKIAGSSLIVCSCSAIGFLVSNNLKERIGELELIKKIFLMMRGEIKYNHATLSEAFGTIGKRLKSPYSFVLLQMSEQLDSLEGQPLSQIWEQNLKEMLKASCLCKEDKEKLLQLGSQLGYLDMEMQLNTIDWYLEQIQEETKSARENLKRNGKLYQTMGVMAGIFLVILML